MSNLYISNEESAINLSFLEKITFIGRTIRRAFTSTNYIIYEGKELISKLNGTYDSNLKFEDLSGEFIDINDSETLYSSVKEDLRWSEVENQLLNVENFLNTKSGVLSKGLSELSKHISVSGEGNPFLQDIFGVNKLGPMIGLGLAQGMTDKGIPNLSFNNNTVKRIEGCSKKRLIEFIKRYTNLITPEYCMSQIKYYCDEKCKSIVDKAISKIKDEQAKKAMTNIVTRGMFFYFDLIPDIIMKAAKKSHELALHIASSMQESSKKPKSKKKVSKEELLNIILNK